MAYEEEHSKSNTYFDVFIALYNDFTEILFAVTAFGNVTVPVTALTESLHV
jgi:hypothetical protein